MTKVNLAALHDAYAADYDAQVAAYDCHIAEVLFGLTYEYVKPGERLLDAGVGSGISSALFATVGLEVYGMDFSQSMLDICAAKGFATGLACHDLQQVPWPYRAAMFHHVVCCGVLHFIAELEAIFAEAGRVLREDGTFAFTTRAARDGADGADDLYEREVVGAFEIFSHSPTHVDALLRGHGFLPRKTQRCYVGEDLFMLWVAQKQGDKR
jgi:predicted TPR repeat methyltransferase